MARCGVRSADDGVAAHILMVVTWTRMGPHIMQNLQQHAQVHQFVVARTKHDSSVSRETPLLSRLPSCSGTFRWRKSFSSRTRVGLTKMRMVFCSSGWAVSSLRQYGLSDGVQRTDTRGSQAHSGRVVEACQFLRFLRRLFYGQLKLCMDLTDVWFYESKDYGPAAFPAACLLVSFISYNGLDDGDRQANLQWLDGVMRDIADAWTSQLLRETRVLQLVREEMRILQMIEFEVDTPTVMEWITLFVWAFLLLASSSRRARPLKAAARGSRARFGANVNSSDAIRCSLLARQGGSLCIPKRVHVNQE